MAIEDQLDRLATAIEALTAALHGKGQIPMSLEAGALPNVPTTTLPPPGAATPAGASATGRRPRGRPPANDNGAAEAAQPSAAAQLAQQSVDYETVRSKVLGLAKSHGMDVAVGILASFNGAKTAKEIPSDQWPALLAKVDAAAAGGIA